MFKKNILVILICAAFSLPGNAQRVTRKGSQPATAQKQPTRQLYSLTQFEGKWQEVKRTRGGNRIVAFTDTLFLHFYSNDSVTTRNGLEMNHRGIVQLEENQIVLAGDEYTIVRFVKDMILDDGTFIRVLEKKPAFYSESLGNIKIPVEDFSTPLNIDAQQLIGKWDVYRTQAKPGGSAPGDALIRSLEFTSVVPISGTVSFQIKGASESLPFEAKFEDKILKINTPSHAWAMHIYKLTDNELVFGHFGELLYYAKRY